MLCDNRPPPHISRAGGSIIGPVFRPPDSPGYLSLFQSKTKYADFLQRKKDSVIAILSRALYGLYVCSGGGHSGYFFWEGRG